MPELSLCVPRSAAAAGGWRRMRRRLTAVSALATDGAGVVAASVGGWLPRKDDGMNERTLGGLTDAE